MKGFGRICVASEICRDLPKRDVCQSVIRAAQIFNLTTNSSGLNIPNARRMRYLVSSRRFRFYEAVAITLQRWT